MLFKDSLSSSNGNLPHSDQVVSVAGKQGLKRKGSEWAQMQRQFSPPETLHFNYVGPLIFAGLSPVVIRV